MRAVVVNEFGGPEQLRVADIPAPEPGRSEVLIAVEVAGVLFLDTQLRAGWGRDFFHLDLPYVPGVYVAGTVAEVGEGVDPTWRGARVVGSTSRPGEHRGGGYAERAVVAADGLHRIPDEIDATTALSAGDGVMAVTLTEKSGLSDGDTAVVTAASGSIGTWLVSMLKDAGVRVVAAAHGPAKIRLARERGADVVADYSEEDWAAELPRDVDVVFDGAGGALRQEAFRLLRRGGRFFSYGSAAGYFPDVAVDAADRDITVIGLDEHFTADLAYRAMETALGLLADGTVVPVIGRSLPLERAAEAHAAMAERRVLGKTVLTL